MFATKLSNSSNLINLFLAWYKTCCCCSNKVLAGCMLFKSSKTSVRLAFSLNLLYLVIDSVLIIKLYSVMFPVFFNTDLIISKSCSRIWSDLDSTTKNIW